jgi:hypothetical protein
MEGFATFLDSYAADTPLSCTNRGQLMPLGYLVGPVTPPLNAAQGQARGRGEGGVECVFYTERDLETLLEQYLGNEAERARLAAAGQARAQALSLERAWEEVFGLIEGAWGRPRPDTSARFRWNWSGLPRRWATSSAAWRGRSRPTRSSASCTP